MASDEPTESADVEARTEPPPPPSSTVPQARSRPDEAIVHQRPHHPDEAARSG